MITNCNTTFANCKMMNRLMCQHVGAHGSFPTPQELSRFTVPKLRSICKVGYRDQRIHRFAQKVVAGEFDLDWWDSNLPGDRYGTFESASEIVDQARSRLDSIWGFGRFSVNNTLQLAGVFSVVPVDTETRKLQAYISSALKEKEAEEEEEEAEEKEEEEEEKKEEVEEEEEKKDEENEEEEDEDEYKPTKSKKGKAKPKKKKQRRRASSAMDMKKLDEATQLAFAKYSPFQFLAYWFELYDYRGRFPKLADASGLVGEPTPNEAEAMEEEKKAETLTKEEREAEEEEEEEKGQSNKKRKRSSVEKPKKRKAATEAKNPRKDKKQKSQLVSAASKPATTRKQKKTKGAKDA